MRIVLSVVSLLVVLVAVMKLAGQQAHEAVHADGGRKAAEQAAGQIEQAMGRAAAARASESAAQ